MSSETEHIALANKNQAVLNILLQDLPTCAEWAAIVAFYKALHVVEAAFARENPPLHIHNHHDRLEKLKKTSRYAPIFPHYRPLFTASLVARDLECSTAGPGGQPLMTPYARFEDYLPALSLRADLLDRYLHPLENVVATILSPNANAGLVRYARTPTP